MLIDLNIWTRTYSTWLEYANTWKIWLPSFDLYALSDKHWKPLIFRGKKRLFLKCFRRTCNVPYQHRNYWGLFPTIDCKCQWVLWYLWKYLLAQRKIMYCVAAIKNGSNGPFTFTMKIMFSLCVRCVCNQVKRQRTSPVIAYSRKWANYLWRKNLKWFLVCSIENHAESEKLAALTKTGTTFMFVFVYEHGNEERPFFHCHIFTECWIFKMLGDINV